MSDIKFIMQSTSGQFVDVPEEKLDEWLKSQPSYEQPKPMTNKEKIDWLVQLDNSGFDEGVLANLFTIDENVESLICNELEKEGVLERRLEKDGVLWVYLKQDKNKMLEIIEKYINK